MPLSLHQPRKHEEQIGVRIPGQGPHMVKVMVGALESDEDILSRISTTVGTFFNVTGTRYEVVSSQPFKLKKLRDNSRDHDDEEPVAPKVKASVPPPVAPPSEPPKSVQRLTGPSVGERWKPKDPRRKSSFVVAAIEGDQAVTDDGRRIQLARFIRYERL